MRTKVNMFVCSIQPSKLKAPTDADANGWWDYGFCWVKPFTTAATGSMTSGSSKVVYTLTNYPVGQTKPSSVNTVTKLMSQVRQNSTDDSYSTQVTFLQRGYDIVAQNNRAGTSGVFASYGTFVLFK